MFCSFRSILPPGIYPPDYYKRVKVLIDKTKRGESVTDEDCLKLRLDPVTTAPLEIYAGDGIMKSGAELDEREEFRSVAPRTANDIMMSNFRHVQMIRQVVGSPVPRAVQAVSVKRLAGVYWIDGCPILCAGE